MNIRSIRKYFPVIREYLYLNHAAHSPLSTVVTKTIKTFIDQWSETGDPPIHMISEFKHDFGSLIGANEDEIASIPNTSTGINVVVNMIKLKRGNNVVVSDREFPCNVHPWLMRQKEGLEVRYTKSRDGKVSPEDVEKLTDDNTVAISVSSVDWQNGYRIDLRRLSEIAHEHSSLLTVDAHQSVGALHMDVKRDDVDFLSCASDKWLMGPSGCGFLYIRKDLWNQLVPTFVRWSNIKYEGVYEFNLKKVELREDIHKFDIGRGLLGNLGTRASIDLIQEFGMKEVEKRILELTDQIVSELQKLNVEIQTPLEEKSRSGIINFRMKEGKEFCDKLRSHKVITSYRGGGIRVSPHFYNTKKDIDEFIDKVKSLIQE